MGIATFVIPVSAQHAEMGIHHKAIESAQAQTIPCEVIVEIDHNRTGAGATRNRAMAKVKTPFAVFLDADDVVKPTFVESCVKSYRPGTYVYTDWVLHGLVVNTPNTLNMWYEGQEHVITTLLPTIAWREVGGFDETLDTLEDEDFYRKLHAYGWRGVRCAEPLIVYQRNMGHSLVNKDNVEDGLQKYRVAEKHALFSNRYQRFKDVNLSNINNRQPNDVLAEPLYSHSREEGAVSKRLYISSGAGEPLWVDIDDARARPDMYKIIARNPMDISPDIETVKRLVKEAIADKQTQSRNLDLTELTRDELFLVANDKGIKVTGTGSRGYVKREDLIYCLRGVN